MADGQDAITPQALIAAMGARARAAAEVLRTASSERKAAALISAAHHLWQTRAAVFDANILDMDDGAARGLSSAMLDRLRLDEGRLRGVCDGLRAVAEQRDPVGAVIAEWDVPSGLHIQRVRTPIGVIGVIFESRPNVTADAGALCLKAGNAAILRGGSESARTSAAIHAALVAGLQDAGLPADAIQLVPTQDRAAVGAMLAATDHIDVIVPRGGRNLVALVQAEARVPVFAHLEGICHVYVDGAADPARARAIVLNAKTRRTGICGAAECLLIDWRFYTAHGAPMIADLIAAGVEVRTEGELLKIPGTVAARPDDFGREFLDMIIAARLVDGVDAATAHVRRYGSNHTDAIVTADDAVWARFQAGTDSAIVLRNASTQFADGGEFRHGRGDRDRHRQAACARAGGGGTADQLPLCGDRDRHAAALMAGIAAASPAPFGQQGGSVTAPSHFDYPFATRLAGGTVVPHLGHDRCAGLHRRSEPGTERQTNEAPAGRRQLRRRGDDKRTSVMATNDARPQGQPQPQAQGQTGSAGQAPANPRQMEGQTQPAAPQQGSTPLRDWASI